MQTLKRFGLQLGLLFLMMVTGTAIDFAVHHSHDAWYVEPEYYVAKILFGTVWGIVAVWLMLRVLRETRIKALAVGVPAIIAIFLQTKYFYQGRALDFVFIFLVLHYLMFLPGSFWIFSRHQSTFVDPVIPLRSRRWGLFAAVIVALEALFWVYFKLFPPFS
jgi:hypothetical protein